MKLRNAILASILAALTVFSGTAPLVARAQSRQSDSVSESGAFSAKADKVLKQIHRAAGAAAADPEGGRGAAAAKLEKLSRVSGVRRNARGGVSVGLLVQLKGEDASELKAAGFAVGSVIGDIATVEADASRLPELAALGSVVKLSAAAIRRPVNDRARRSVGIDNASAQRVVGQTGAGVVVGIIDSGIDFRHRDFTKPGSNGTQTRIKYLLDMTAYGGSTAGWDYTLPGGTAKIGKLYTEAQINAALAVAKPDQASDPVRQRDKSGHGTHVAGTAAGNGLGAGTSANTYAGMAPEADLIIVKASRQDTGDASFRADDTVNGLKFVQAKAAELGEPFVINMSIGGQAGPHDGTSFDERAIDNLVTDAGGNSIPGRAVCVAAGNEGSDSIHARTTVPAGGSVTLTYNAFEPDFIDLYYKNTDRFRVTITKPDGSTFGPVSFSANGFSNANGQVSDPTFELWNALDNKGDGDASNDQPDIFVTFEPGAPAGTWLLKIEDADSVANSELDAWTSGGFDPNDSDNWTKFTGSFVDNNSHLVSSPGTSRGAITVGAFVTRSATQTLENYAPFTSPGPTADGRQKPDISAPGYYLYSSRSSDVADASMFTYGTSGNALASGVSQSIYGGLAGTSMATPVVTGSVALLLQANRNLTAEQVKSLIENNSNHDGFDPLGWNPRFGFGKLNIAATIAAIGGTVPASNPIDSSEFFVTQHYRDFLGREPDASGLAFWKNEIDQCGGNAQCREVKRINVSAAFFLSIEFQNTGYLVERMYKAAYGDFTEPSTGLVVPVIRRDEFMQDTPIISSGVVVNVGDWQTQLENNKNSYARTFVSRARFTNAFPVSMTPAAFVDKLNSNAGLVLSDVERTNLINELTGAADPVAARASVLRKVAENAELDRREKNRAFVLMEYFGYLRRNPNDAPERDLNYAGYNFWYSKLNEFGGNFVRAEMVKAFLDSIEYRSRFGTP